MHVALEAPDPARPVGEHRPQTRIGARWPRPGTAALWLAGLLVVICLSMADAFYADTVAYERDTTVFYYPLMTWFADQLHHGQLPLWTPQVFGGYPIFADGEIGLAYPPALLAVLVLPADTAFIFLRLLHLCIAAVGMFALARAWRLPHASATLAGLVFTLGSFLSAQIHHENIVRTVSWLPVMLALVERALQAADWRPRLQFMMLASAALGLGGLSLHSQLLAIDLLILAGYSTFRWAVGPLPLRVQVAKRRWWPRFTAVAVVCGPVVLLGVGLAAVQIVPLVELAGFSPRGSGIPYSEAAAYSLTPYGLLQLIFPYLFRGPAHQQWGLWTHWESYLYVGLVPLLLVMIALVCVRRAEVRGWGVMAGIGIIMALGQYSPINLHYVLWLLPGLSGLRAPGRFTVVTMLAAAMLAAYGLAWLEALASGGTHSSVDRQRLQRLLHGLAVGVIALTILTVAAHLALLGWPDAAQTVVSKVYLALPRDAYPLTPAEVVNGLLWSTNVANPWVSGALLGLALIIVSLWAWQIAPAEQLRKWRGWSTWLVSVAACDLLLFAWAVHPRESLHVLGAEPAAIAALDKLPSVDAAPNRMLAQPILAQVAADRLAAVTPVQEANGYSSLQFIWHRDYINRVLYVDDSLLDLWNVRYLLDPAHYGTLSNYKDVTFLVQQALMHSPSGGSLSEQSFSLRSISPITELRFVSALMGAIEVPQGTPVAEVELRDAAGGVVGTAELQAGRDTMDWGWDLPTITPYVKHDRVESAGLAHESGPGQTERQLSFGDLVFGRAVDAQTLTIRTVVPVGEFVVYGVAAMSEDGTTQQLFGRSKTKYRQVYVDNEIRVLENTAAQPRAFIVPRARVAASLGTALNDMVHQPFRPDQEVILADDMRAQAVPLVTDRGGQGAAQITAYSADDVQIHTSASADAWLVLSDTYYPGWTAAVDGQPSPILRGDVLFRVVPVPGGQHDVDFRFEPASVKYGLFVSLTALVVVFVGFAVAGVWTRPRRTTST